MKITPNNVLARIRLDALQKQNPCCWKLCIVAQQALDRSYRHG